VVEWVDAGRRIAATGRELMSTGVTVALAKPFSSEILRFSAKPR
jgi:hypothetical protein